MPNQNVSNKNKTYKMSPTNRQTTARTQWFSIQIAYSLLLTIVLLMFSTPAKAAVHSVFTYKNASTQLGQLVTSSTLFWESYDVKDPKQLNYAVEGGKYITEDEHYPIYVCRVTIDGVPTSGHTEKILQSHVCVAAHYKHKKYENFDVLVNKGHLGKISWKPWRKFDAGIPVGAIRIGEDVYIARHRATHHNVSSAPSNDGEIVHNLGADFNLGRYDPVGLGKIKVIENERDKDYEEGEVLIETEPFRYELKDIKINTFTLDMRENWTELASSILVNQDDKYGLVEAAMSYEFDHMQYWGTHEGVARGLPTKVYEKDVTTPADINWALKYVRKHFETKSVHTKLYPGTALNVTLRGNYVTLQAQYTAKLIAFYYGSEDSVSRKITSEVRKSYLKEVKMEFSPVYWTGNGTIVPTTTTTSTTSTTTLATTTSTGEPKPMHEPPVVHMKDLSETHSGPDSLEKSMQDTVSNEIPENMAEKQQKPALAGVAADNGAAKFSMQQCLYATMATLFTVTLLNI